MSPSRELRVEIIGDAKSLQRALGDATDHTTKFGSALKTLGKVAAVGAAAGFAALGYTIKRGFDELGDAQKQMKQTEAALKSTGSAANVTAKQVTDLATAISKMSGIDDEAVQAGENMLLTFTNVRNEVGKGNDIFNQATQAIADMATRMNDGAIPSAEQLSKTAIQVGKALNDPIKGLGSLRRVGVDFTESQKTLIEGLVKSGKTMEAQKIILAELTKEFGGSAKAAGETFPGQLAKLRNAFDEAAGALAAKLLPYLVKFVAWINENSPKFAKAFDAVGNAIVAVAEVVRRNFDTIKSVGLSAFNGIRSAGEKFIAFMRTTLGQQIAAAAIAIFGLGKAFVAVRAGITVLNTALIGLKSNPFFLGLVGLGIAVGVLAQKFIADKIAAAGFASAVDRASLSADELKASLDRLKGSETALESSKLALIRATRDLAARSKEWHDIIREGAQKTDRGKEAYLAYREALNNVKSATNGVTAAEKEHKDAIAARNAALTAGERGILATSDALRKQTDSHFSAQAASVVYAEAMGRVARENATAAEKVRGTDKAASDAARKASIMAAAARDLATELGRIPTHKEIITRAKLEGKSEVIKGVDGLIATVRGKAGAAAAAGAVVGGQFGSGMASGIIAYYVNVANAALQLVAAAANAVAKRQESGSDSRLAMRLGQDFSSGYASGIIAGGQRIREGAVRVVGGAIEAAAQATLANRQKLVSAFETVASDALAAFDKRVANWTPPSLKVIARIELQTEIANLQKGIDDAKEALIEATQGYTDAANAVADLMAGKFTPEQQKALEGLSPEERAAQIQQWLDQAQQAALDAWKAMQKAQSDLADAQQAQRLFDLQQQADKEQAAHDKKVAAARAKLVEALGEIAKDIKSGAITLAKAIDEAAAAISAAAKGLGGGGGGGPGRQGGGQVLRRRSYIVGERGRELFVPDVSGRIIPLGHGGRMGGGINVSLYVGGSVMSERDLVATVQDGLLRVLRTNGKLGF